MKRLTLLLTCFFISMGLAIAQNAKVTGTVVDESGEAIIGASVVVKGNATVGTVTNVDGEFTLDVPNVAKVLIVRYIGMIEQEVAVASNMRVVLKPSSTALDEVIVVAFGTAKRSSFTGSVSTMKSEAIEKRQVSNVTNALVGQVAGVQVTSTNGQPGTTSTVRIRGFGSMAAGNAPLYVVDGVPFDGDISSINTSDIESTSVLKDAASNALYGSRGANGVILITTKRAAQGKATISLDARWGVNSRAVPNYDVIKDPGLYLEQAYKSIYSGYIGAGKTAEQANALSNADLPTNSNGGVGYQIYTLPSGQSLIGMDGKLNPAATLGYSDGTYTYRPDDWYKELFDKGNLRQEYNANVSGTSDKFNYFASVGYLDDSGIIKNSGFTRYSARLKGDYQARKWLKVGANMAFTNYDSQSQANQTDDRSSSNLFYLTNYIAPVYPLYTRDAQGKIMVDSRGYTVYDFGDGTSGSGNFKRTFMSGSNPASMVGLDKVQNLADVFSGRWFATVEFMEGLKFTYNFGFDTDNTTYRRLYNAYYGQYSRVGGIVYGGATRTTSVNNQQLLTYRKLFNNVHDLDILLGHEAHNKEYKYLNAKKEKLFNPDVVEIDNGILNPSASSYSEGYSTEGWLGRVQYEYDGKYVFGGSYRRDASSRFHPDNRWGDFGSISGAWVMNKESFMQDLKWIDFLKLKLSYGVQGNDDLLYPDLTRNYYPYQDQYQVSENNKDFATVLTYKGNKDITWETSHSTNAGIDFNLWEGRFSGTVEYFNRDTKNLLYYMPVSPSQGYASVPKNIGSIRNGGYEFDLHSNVYKSNDINVNVYANATMLKNKILELAPELNGELIDGLRIYREGESMYQLYVRRSAGVNDQGVALYYMDIKDDNGKITGVETTTEYNKATQYASGDLLPNVYGGFGFTVDAYGFDFSASAAYQLGGKILDAGYQNLMHSGAAGSAGFNWHKDILNSWMPDNQTNIPRLNNTDLYTNQTSDRFIIASDYLDITNITLGYTLPKNLLKKLDVGSLRIYFAADNVALFSKRDGLDPRQSFTSSGGYRYSPIRSISGGISLKF